MVFQQVSNIMYPVVGTYILNNHRRWHMAIITPQELQDELNIDDDENELKTLKSLISGATAMIKASIQMKIIDDDILAVDAELYNRLIKTLATSMYYDRELSNGYSTGVRIMLTNLRSEIVGATNA